MIYPWFHATFLVPGFAVGVFTMLLDITKEPETSSGEAALLRVLYAAIVLAYVILFWQRVSWGTISTSMLCAEAAVSVLAGFGAGRYAIRLRSERRKRRLG